MMSIGVVVIGRNEGQRLKNCIHSLLAEGLKIVYVDSDSTDDSVSFVRGQGFDVVELDMSIPFSAARARNEGYQFLLKHYPEVEYIQFVDGDCEVSNGWIRAAYEHLDANKQLAAVCGRRKERFPDATIYNKLCDIEWDTPIGITAETGGDFMCKKQALVEVNGFNPAVIAGEEPELCFRIRQQGWLIERIDKDMTLHDANITHYKQWWKRNERSGHAYAHVAHLHINSEEKIYQKQTISKIVWGLLMPLILLVGLLVSVYLVALVCLLYLHLFYKLIKDGSKRLCLPGKEAFAYALSNVLGKVPHAAGVIKYLYRNFVSNKNFSIIEYK